MAGGAVPTEGQVVISTERMNRVLDISKTNRIARCQPGLITARLKELVTDEGLWYPPDPASYRESTIGGNVATNAGGILCLKYGVTGDYVLGMELVLGDGSIVRLGGACRKDVAGYDLASIVVGSEGTLGIVSEVTLRLLPGPQPSVVHVIAQFDRLEKLCDAVCAVYDAGLDPAALEMMDQKCVWALDSWLGRPHDSSLYCSLFALIETTDDRVPASLSRYCDIMRKFGAQTVTDSQRDSSVKRMIEERRDVFKALRAIGPVVSEDVCVPRDRLGALMKAIRQVEEDNKVEVAILAHIGDGNVHPHVCYPDTPDGNKRAKAAFSEIMSHASLLGGTISGEHGIGSLKIEELEQHCSSSVVDLMRHLKGCFDPLDRLNPGKIFTARETEQQSTR
jgi:glycolate oxidase